MGSMNIGLITPYGNDNYGNKLQTYALQSYIEINYSNSHVEVLKNIDFLNNKSTFLKNYIINYFKIKRYNHSFAYSTNSDRAYNFRMFNKNINYSKQFVSPYFSFNKFDFVIVGSDQVWNPNHYRLSDVELLKFVSPSKRVSYAASFGINSLPIMYEKKVGYELNKYKYISVREESGKKIVEELINRKDVQVLIDPTMLLDANDWDKISKKPEKLKSKEYILNYFLGDLSDERKIQIEKIAKENQCEIINLMDKDDPLYVSGPSEFLYLEKHAFLICTDSFHSSVFAILYDRPFVVFEREQDGVENMNSRIDTLIEKFNLKNRKYNGKSITNVNLCHDYTEAYKILKKERKKSDDFLKKALEISNK